MTNYDDNIRLHIEIETSESEQMKDLINKLEKADNKLSKIKSDRTARKIFESEAGAPVDIETDQGPIFRNQEEAEEVARTTRPGKKGQAIQRQDAFKNLQDKLGNLEEKQTTLEEKLQELSPLLLITGGFKNGIFSFIRPLIPYIGEALIALGIVEKIVDNLLGPGGAFDRRFKLIIEKLIANFFSRQLKASIRQGFSTIIATSYIGPRGARQGQFSTTNQGINRLNYVYDEKLERLTKGVY